MRRLPWLVLAGCALPTARIPHPSRPTWFNDPVFVCADLSADDRNADVEAATEAWTVGPRLAYVGKCDGQRAHVGVYWGSWEGVALGYTSRDVTMGQINSARVEIRGDIGLEYDLQSLVTHELGHALGLRDSPHQEATMFSLIAPFEERARDLAEDDVQQVEDLYGSGDASQ